MNGDGSEPQNSQIKACYSQLRIADFESPEVFRIPHLAFRISKVEDEHDDEEERDWRGLPKPRTPNPELQTPNPSGER